MNIHVYAILHGSERLKCNDTEHCMEYCHCKHVSRMMLTYTDEMECIFPVNINYSFNNLLQNDNAMTRKTKPVHAGYTFNIFQ